jgi:hypothetical protein
MRKDEPIIKVEEKEELKAPSCGSNENEGSMNANAETRRARCFCECTAPPAAKTTSEYHAVLIQETSTKRT